MKTKHAYAYINKEKLCGITSNENEKVNLEFRKKIVQLMSRKLDEKIIKKKSTGKNLLDKINIFSVNSSQNERNLYLLKFTPDSCRALQLG